MNSLDKNVIDAHEPIPAEYTQHSSLVASIIAFCRRPFLRRHLLLCALLLYTAIWLLGNGPALGQAWWYVDDLAFGDEVASVQGINKMMLHTLQHGRPFQTLLVLSYQFDNRANETLANRLLRLLQGALHILSALVAGYLLWRQTRSWTAYLALLPFLVWPFNGEAILWQAALIYPVSALLGMLALWLIRRDTRHPLLSALAGILLITLGMFACQVSIFTGLIIWIFLVGLSFLKDSTVPIRGVQSTPFTREGIVLFSAYLIGSATSYLISYALTNGYGRAQFSHDIIDKILYLEQLNRQFLTWPEFYPLWLAAAHLILILMLPLVLLRAWSSSVHSLRRPRVLSRAIIAVACILTAIATPYLTILLVAENAPSWRVMYLAPLLITGVWLLLDQALAAWKLARLTIFALLCVILIGYIQMSRTNAAEYVQVFQSDLHVLRQLEDYVAQEHINDNMVNIAAYPEAPVNNWNPYGIKYLFADSKLSAFYKSWSAYPFIRWFSQLNPTEDKIVHDQCLDICRTDSNNLTFQFYKLGSNGPACICLP
ncbi:MAG: hypothetical protein EXR62_02135 [Chloroflexi bacterium]|nr:hypothetical protein [Chloroflexota bacterium]